MNNQNGNPTPRDQRASARQNRQLLQLPQHGLGRAELIRSRSPSPIAPGVFNFPQVAQLPEGDQFENARAEQANILNMATQEQLDAIRDELRQQMRAELRNEAAASGAQIPDAIKRKPEIPAFDKKQVDHWIRRTENAFIRALCNTPREKFAFLETKFPVDFNPRINEFLWGDPTEDKWKEFLAYLRSEYGTTRQQRAAVILDGFKRDGRKPSQYVALLEEKTKDIDLNDVRKEMLLREMPTDVQRMLQERFEGLSLRDAAKAADAYFDQEGKLRQKQPTNVNAVQEASSDFTSPFTDDSEDVNAINRRFQNQKSRGNNNFQRGGRGRPQRGGSNHAYATQTGAQQKPFSKPVDPALCFYHNEFGDKAKKCEVGCKRFDEKRFAGNDRAGK